MNIIITGGSRGIGFELVKQFALNSNHHIVVCSRDIDKLEQLKDECFKKNKKDIHIYKVDFCNSSFETDVQQLLEKEKKHFHVLINNAGYLINKPFLETNSEDWKQTFNTNFFSPIILIKQLINQNNKNDSTHIVNIGSMGGFQGSTKFSGLSAYSSSKAALASITECLAEEFKETNVKFNCLALGAVQTEMLNEAFPNYQAQVNVQQMAKYIVQFSLEGHQLFNGKVIPVSLTTP